ncbi:hypothetical protein ACR9E3_19020 [Actinomycetospora sp. C-140]
MTIAPQDTAPTLAVTVDEHAARTQLRAQIARLEHRLATAGPAVGGPVPVRGPRVLDLGELERVRDDLVERVGAVDRAAAARTRAVAAAHACLAGMLADPAAHRGAVVTSADLGERGCVRWAVRPVLGPVGRLAGWWRVRMSSGCP